jgi:putative hydrolase of the HAD superfamily
VAFRAVLLDALGTMVELERPWPHLVGELAARGVEVGEDLAREAMLAEIAHYRAHHDEGATPAGLAALRRDCARVVAAALGPPAAGLALDEVEAAMLAAVRFRPYPDVPGALGELRRAGCRLVAVSNWDVSLHDVLAELGLARHLAGAVTSAEAGAAKPDPAIFARALAVAGVGPGEALHAGDSVEADVLGARGAGIAAALVDRHGGDGLRSVGAGAAAPAGVPVVRTLAELPDLVR